jgi:hypothetical protein
VFISARERIVQLHPQALGYDSKPPYLDGLRDVDSGRAQQETTLATNPLYFPNVAIVTGPQCTTFIAVNS